ncbi:MAG: cache domain-containing protein [Sulfurimonas sp.]|nr:cache domain-containing protein [Sulfurimonas sp.]
MKLYQKYLALILLILLVSTAYFYMKSEREFQERIHSVLINLLNKQVANEKEKAFNFALALSQNETLQKAITSNNTQKSYIILKNYMKTIETFSGSQLRIQIVSKDYTILARSWDNTDAGVNVKKNRPDLEEVKQTLKAHLSFVAARRLVLIASIPIIEDGELIAFLEVIQRFGELEQYFSNYGVGLVVLLDDKYEKQAVLLKNRQRISNMIVANLGANINYIEILKKVNLQKLWQHGYVKKDQHLFFYTSILNADDENIGAFVLVLSEERLKLFNAFEQELDTFFTYARKDIYNSVKTKKRLNPYNKLSNKELLTLKNCADNKDKKYIEEKLSTELQSYTKDELISLLLETNPNNISRGKIK